MLSALSAALNPAQPRSPAWDDGASELMLMTFGQVLHWLPHLRLTAERTEHCDRDLELKILEVLGSGACVVTWGLVLPSRLK